MLLSGLCTVFQKGKVKSSVTTNRAQRLQCLAGNNQSYISALGAINWVAVLQVQKDADRTAGRYQNGCRNTYFAICQVNVVVCICLQISLIQRPHTVIFSVTQAAVVQALDKFKSRLVTSRQMLLNPIKIDLISLNKLNLSLMFQIRCAVPGFTVVA